MQKIKIPDTYYINNDLTNVRKVYEEFFEIRTGSKHKKCRKTKKLVSQKNRQKMQTCISPYSIK